jgi:hypothetical protein
MCTTLSELGTQMRTFALGFDPTAFHPAQLDEIVDRAARIEKMAGAVKAAAAARAVELHAWERHGDPTPAHTLAKKTGVSVTAAKDMLEAATLRQAMPRLDAAALGGDLSASQTSLIADAVAADPGAEARLLDLARRASLGELRDECARVKARVIDLEARHERIRAARRVRTYEDRDGAANLHLATTPEALAEVMAVLRPLSDALFNRARSEGGREPAEAYLADAVVEMARRAAGADGEAKPVKAAKVIVRIDWDTLVRGWPIDGEVCEIGGLGPVPVSLVRALIDSGDAFLAAVMTKGKDVVNVAHLGRRATAHQYSALQWLSPTCSVEGCNSSLGLEVDHRVDWAKTRITLLSLLNPLCRPHHKMKTLEGWGLVEGHGKRAFVGPHDARHPQNAHAPPAHAAM